MLRWALDRSSATLGKHRSVLVVGLRRPNGHVPGDVEAPYRRLGANLRVWI